MKKLYQRLASLVQARLNCEESGNREWFHIHEEEIERLVREYLPSGSGVDAGATVDLDASTGNKLVLHTSFHHMDEGGGYDGWTEHKVVVKPDLMFGFDLKVTGKDRNQIKEYIGECFGEALEAEVPSQR